MAYLNNIYGNAAFVGAAGGVLAGRSSSLSATSADYDAETAAAVALAQQVDSNIAFDALVTTGSAITQLAITTNTIAANEQWRAGLLQEMTNAFVQGRALVSATAAFYATLALAIKAAWTSGLARLVTP